MPSLIAPNKLCLQRPKGHAGRQTAIEFGIVGAATPPAASAELVAACQLIPCMARKRPLELPGALDSKLAAGLLLIMKLLSAWSRDLHPVAVSACAGSGSAGPIGRGGGVAACFTGGVDSFYTLVTRRQEINTLVYVLGYDLQRKQTALWEQVRSMLERVAAEYGKRLVIVETNLRVFLDPVLPWGLAHGAALAAVGHLLSGEIRRLIIPSSYSAGQLHPWGSHPDLDPLWSSEHLEIVHDSIKPNRLEKLRTLVQEGLPLDHLRVCWENPNHAYNCGTCAKCFRTMAGLAALGCLDKAPVFPPTLDLPAAARLDLGDETDGLFLAEVREELARNGREPELAAFLARLPVANRPTEVPFSALRLRNAQCGEPLLIKSARLEIGEDTTSLRVPVQWGSLRTQLEIEFDLGGKPPAIVGDALLLWFILPAMRHRVPLVLEDPVSAELLETIDQAQGLWSTYWGFAGHSRVEVRAPTAEAPEPLPGRPWGAAFSSGVDAIFTALSESDRIGYLAWIQGMDSDAIDQGENERTHRWMQEGAAALGKRLVTVRSNLRRVLFRELDVNWPFMYIMSPYGLAHLMQAHISGMFIAAEVSYAEMFSKTAQLRYNPILDPWLQSRQVAIKVHGMTHNRFDKVVALAKRPDLLDKLVVCQQRAVRGFAGGRNCGRCEKCQRTLIAIRMAGARHPAGAFDQPLDLDRLRDTSAAVPLVFSRLQYYQTLLGYLQKQGNDPELLEILSHLVHLAEGKAGLGNAASSPLDSLRADPGWPGMVKDQAEILAATVLADKPSARLGALIDDPPSSRLAEELLRALMGDEGRGKVLRRAIGRMLRLDFGKRGAK